MDNRSIAHIRWNCTCHRTTIAHFLNHGRWDDASLEDTLKRTVTQIIYKEVLNSGKPVFYIVGD